VVITIGVGLLAFLIGRGVSQPARRDDRRDARACGPAGSISSFRAADGRDEIGAMSGAVEVFKVNAIERLRLEAEAKQAEVRAASRNARRTCSGWRTNSSPPSANIIHTVSAASTQLEAAAKTL